MVDKSKVSEGDKVKIFYEKDGDKVLEGVLLPRPELLTEGVLILKLESGYNIGIKENRIKKIELIQKYEPIKDKESVVKNNPKLPNVSVLSFGGTISSKIDYKTGGVAADYTAEDFVAMSPDLAKVANLKAKKIASMMSEDMGWNDWKVVASSICEEINKKDVDGVVATCGTDTMHYITGATSFFLKSLNKPVVFTASQRSIDRGSSDAFINLKCAIVAAANSDVAEVMTCMHGTTNDDYCLLIRGTKVRKMHTSRRDAFRPINDRPFAKVYAKDCNIEYENNNYIKVDKEKKCELDTEYTDKVALILIHPSIDGSIIDYYVDKGYKGIVLSATALGHVPTNGKSSILKNIENAIKKGVVIVIASQTIYGRTHPYVYTNLRKLSVQNKCIFVSDMLPEVAYIKLGYVLGHKEMSKDISLIKTAMLENMHGEINPRHRIDEFLY